MEIIEHNKAENKIAEIKSNKTIINSASDALDILGDIYYQGYNSLIIHENLITKDFFDLKNGMAGEILQKFSNYRLRLAIIGDFSVYRKQSIIDFIFESNRTGQINFTSSLIEAIQKLS